MTVTITVYPYSMIALHDFFVFVYDSLLVRWSTRAHANAIDVDIHGQLFVATDMERFDCVHLLLGALQQG